MLKVISVTKVFVSVGFSVESVVMCPGSVVVAASGGGGGGSTTFVCMFPARADKDSTQSSVVAAQSC